MKYVQIYIHIHKTSTQNSIRIHCQPINRKWNMIIKTWYKTWNNQFSPESIMPCNEWLQLCCWLLDNKSLLISLWSFVHHPLGWIWQVVVEKWTSHYQSFRGWPWPSEKPVAGLQPLQSTHIPNLHTHTQTHVVRWFSSSLPSFPDPPWFPSSHHWKTRSCHSDLPGPLTSVTKQP